VTTTESKPEFPADVWRTASDMPLDDTGDMDHDISVAIARGIMAERERCASKWLPIESAPKDGTLIIAWASGDLPYISSWMVDRWSHNVSRRRSLMHPQPTHWLIALPPPPNGDVRG